MEVDMAQVNSRYIGGQLLIEKTWRAFSAFEGLPLVIVLFISGERNSAEE